MYEEEEGGRGVVFVGQLFPFGAPAADEILGGFT
jgi:hypothetical protein